jgi:hypothetical protein
LSCQPGAKIVGQAVQAGAQRFLTGLGENGNPGANSRVEICPGAAPVRRRETIRAVMRDRHRPHGRSAPRGPLRDHHPARLDRGDGLHRFVRSSTSAHIDHAGRLA